MNKDQNVLRNLVKVIFVFTLVFSFHKTHAQCGTETLTPNEWCENGFASWEIVDAGTIPSSYVWYQFVDDFAAADYLPNGLFDETNIEKFDSTSSNSFSTPFRVQEVEVGTALNLTYIKLLHDVVHPVGAQTFTQVPNGTDFQIEFTTTDDILLNSVKIPVRLNSPTAVYKIQLEVNPLGLASAVYEFSGISATPLGGDNYLVDVPVNLEIPAGTQTLSVNTTPVAGIGLPVDGLLTSNTQIPTSTDILGFGPNAARAEGGNFTAAYDWNYTVVCDPAYSGEANKATAGCCVVPDNPEFFSLNSTNTFVVSGGAQNVTLTAGPVNPSYYYAWYLDGNLQPALSMQGNNSIDVNQPGNWEVRVITDPARVASDLDDPSCATTGNITIFDQFVFLTEDVRPTDPICLGDEYEFSATGPGNLVWSAVGATLRQNSPTDVTLQGNALDQGSVTVRGSNYSSQLVTNSGFDDANGTFLTELTPSPNANTVSGVEGGYTITSTLGTNPDWILDGSESGFTGNPGNFLLVNQGQDATAKPLIWGERLVGITAGEEYTFSFDFTSVSWVISANGTTDVDNINDIRSGLIGADPKVAILEIFINGVSQGLANPDLAANGYDIVHNWQNYSYNWIAPQGVTEAALEIRVTTPIAPNGTGYDFGLDNISFGLQVVQEITLPIGPFTNCAEMIVSSTDCMGDFRTLTATPSGGAVFERWEDPSGAVIGTNETLQVSPLSPTTYTAYASVPLGNVLRNGNFAAGNVGFRSGNPFFTRSTNLTNGGTNLYDVVQNTSAGNGFWANLPQRPGANDVNRLVADAKGGDAIIGWQFEARAGDEFAFEGWIANQHTTIADVANTGAAHIGVSIVAGNIPNPADPILVALNTDPIRDNNWYALTANWTAPADGVYTLYARSLNPSPDGGNDLVLDDFSLAPVVPNSEISREITVENCACISITAADSIYCGDRATFFYDDLYPTPGGDVVWYDAPTGGNVVTGTKTGTYPQFGFEVDAVDADGPTGANNELVLYAQDESLRQGSFATKPNICGPYTNNDNTNAFSLVFTVFEDVTLSGFDLELSYTQNTAGDFPIEVSLSSTILNANNTFVADNELTSFTELISVTTSGNYVLSFDAGDFVVPGSAAGITYSLQVNGFVNDFRALSTSCNQNLNDLVDDVSGRIIVPNYYTRFGNIIQNAGPINNVNFAALPNPSCPRIPVAVIEDCPPCNKPISVTAEMDTLVCQGTDFDLNATVVHGSSGVADQMKYVWFLSGDPVPSADYIDLATNTTTTIPVRSLTNLITDQEWVLRVQDGDDPTANACYTQDTITITLKDPTVIVTPPSLANPDLCPQDTLILTVEATGANVAYQWTGPDLTGVNVTGATTDSLVIAGVSSIHAGGYTVEVTGDCGVETSPTVNVTVGDPTAIDLQPTSTQECTGVSVDFDVNATGTVPVGNTDFNYQWFQIDSTATADIVRAEPSASTSNFQIDPTAVSDSGYYYVVVEGKCNVDTSDIFFLDITSAVVPEVTLVASDTIVCEGDEITFTAQANGGGASPMFTFINQATNAPLQPMSTSNEYVTVVDADLTVEVIMRSNSLCLVAGIGDEVRDNQLIEVRDSAVANIIAPTSPNDTVFVAVDVLNGITSENVGGNAGFTFSWDKRLAIQQGIITDPTAVSTSLTGLTTIEPDPATGVGTTDLIISVIDVDSICQLSTDTITIVRKDRTTPFLPDTVICETQLPYVVAGNGFIAGIETRNIIDVNNATGMGNNFTYNDVSSVNIPSRPTNFVTGNSADYEFTYQIVNSVTGLSPTASGTITIQADPLPADAGNDTTTCVESIQLNATLPTIGIGVWSCDGGATVTNPTSVNATVSGLSIASPTECVWTVSNGTCVSRTDAMIINRIGEVTDPIISLDGVSFPSGETDICITDINELTGATLDNPATETVAWSIVSSGAIDGAGINGSTVQNLGDLNLLAPGTDTVKYTITSAVPGCDPVTKSLAITVHAEPVADIVDLSSNAVCEGVDITVETQTIGSTDVSEWMGSIQPMGLASSSANTVWTVAADELSIGNNTVTYSVSNAGCPAVEADTTVVVTEELVTSVSIDPLLTQCQGADVTVVANSTGGGPNPEYVWVYSQLGSSDTVPVNTFSYTDLQESSGSVIVFMESSYECPSELVVSDTVPLIVVIGPDPVILTPDTTICVNSPIDLIGQENNDSDGTTHQWFNGNTPVGVPNDLTLNNVSENGSYTLVADNGICQPVPSDPVLVTVRAVPTVSAFANGENSIRAFFDTEVTLSGFYEGNSIDDLGVTGFWVLSSNLIALDDPSIFNPILTAQEGGRFFATLIAVDGPCVDSSTVELILNEPIQAPNVFTPNGDGDNDQFEIKGIDTYPGAKVTIMNRWGSRVYEATDYDSNKWDGGNVPEGVYYYVIKLDPLDELGAGHSGVIHVIR